MSHPVLDHPAGKATTSMPAEQAMVSSGKFRDPFFTADGAERGRVTELELTTLWFNTGTLCNIECTNCYIESSPTNDRFDYIGKADVERYLQEIATLDLPVREIGFTGGEPFLNPDITVLIEAALEGGFDVLVLTNAMKPMQRPAVQRGLLALEKRWPGRMTLRVSLDHYTANLHESERGPGSWASVMTGLDWLKREGFRLSIAGRTCWNESDAQARAGYAALFARLELAVNAAHPGELVLFPEMDENADVPEITTACFGLLSKKPADLMCSNSRMIVRRKGADRTAVLACTLLPYDPQFEMGGSLAESFVHSGGAIDRGAVLLNHPHCARFCMLGGGSCSV